jgi:hypothetical protein
MAYGARRNKGKGLSDFEKPGSEEAKRAQRRSRTTAVATAVVKAESKPDKKAKKAKSGITGEVKEVPIDSVKPNNYNYNQMSAYMAEKLRENIKEFGFLEPVVVRSGDEKGKFEDGRLEIINGYHRWVACTENNMKDIRVLDIGNVSDVRAKALTINLNEIGGKPDQTQLDKLVAEISQIGGDDLVATLPWDEATIEAMVSVGSKDWDALTDIAEDETGSAGGGDDETEGDLDDEENPVTFLGLADTTTKQDIQFIMRLEEIAKKIPYNKDQPGDLFGKMLAVVEKHFNITVDPKLALAVDEPDADADEDVEEVDDEDDDEE